MIKFKKMSATEFDPGMILPGQRQKYNLGADGGWISIDSKVDNGVVTIGPEVKVYNRFKFLNQACGLSLVFNGKISFCYKFGHLILMNSLKKFLLGLTNFPQDAHRDLCVYYIWNQERKKLDTLCKLVEFMRCLTPDYPYFPYSCSCCSSKGLCKKVGNPTLKELPIPTITSDSTLIGTRLFITY